LLIRDDLESAFAYNGWANGRTASSCRGLSVEDYGRALGGGWTSVRDTLVHIASATQAWFERFQGHSPERLLTGADVPELEDATARLAAADASLSEFVRSCPEGDRGKILAYTNLRGQAKHVAYWAVFRHVVNHASYHRGQIASMIRMLGGEPSPTDFVLWAILNTPQRPDS
jgi:uncharacterized damage-inducible protein DinB